MASIGWIDFSTNDRLTFGQPRQQELVDALHESGFSDELIQKLDDLIINLSPVTFQDASSPQPKPAE
ncbi:MAG: hypothetical protein KGP35_01710 [Bacteroidetes bacterium]|nr:hypothetical protein [Bacteroidota bacterium]